MDTKKSVNTGRQKKGGQRKDETHAGPAPTFCRGQHANLMHGTIIDSPYCSSSQTEVKGQLFKGASLWHLLSKHDCCWEGANDDATRSSEDHPGTAEDKWRESKSKLERTGDCCQYHYLILYLDKLMCSRLITISRCSHG